MPILEPILHHDGKIRCPWCGKDPLYIAYHDNEWGVPVHDERKHFEFLVLESVQAGLSWITVLRKRENYRKAFDSFDPVKISGYNETEFHELMQNAGLIRNRLKMAAIITNAKHFLAVSDEFGTFDRYIWSFTGGKVIRNNFSKLSDLPAKTELSDKISKDMIRRGFKFVGSTIVYAHLQAIGIVNDHLEDCFRYDLG